MTARKEPVPYDPNTAKKAIIVLAIRDGMPQGDAAGLAHISRITLWRWKEADPAFALHVDNALSEFEKRLVKRGIEIAEQADDLRASASMTQYLLERRFPVSYGRKELKGKFNAEGQLEGTELTVATGEESAEDVAEWLAGVSDLVGRRSPEDAGGQGTNGSAGQKQVGPAHTNGHTNGLSSQ